MREPTEHSRPSHDDIAALAYQIWEQNGRPAGREVEFWLQAEQSLIACFKPQPQDAAPVAPAVPDVPPSQAKPSPAKSPGSGPKKPRRGL